MVVLGDGPAGSVAALSLAESGARVLLLGSRRGADAAAQTGQCLPAQGGTWMRAFGLTDAFRAGPHLPIVANRAAWARDEIEVMDLIYAAHGHSWLLNRPAFNALLRDAAKARGVLTARRKAGSSSTLRPAVGGSSFKTEVAPPASMRASPSMPAAERPFSPSGMAPGAACTIG